MTFVASPDYESGVTSYSFTVTADDDNGGQATQDVTVNITDVTEVPPNLLIDFEALVRWPMYLAARRPL